MNSAVLGKCLWRIGKGDEGLWKWVLSMKYCVSREGWVTRNALSYHLGIWKGILSVKDSFYQNIRFHIGRRDKILFHLDTWVGDMPLATKFCDILRCAQHKRALVEDYLNRVGEKIIWGPIFRRNLTEIEELQLQVL